MSHIACWWPSGPELVPTSTPGDTVNLLAFKAPPSGLYLPVPAGGRGARRGNPQVTPLDVNLSHLWTHRSFSSL